MGNTQSQTGGFGENLSSMPLETQTSILSYLPSTEIHKASQLSSRFAAVTPGALRGRYRQKPYELEKDVHFQSPVPNMTDYFVYHIRMAIENKDFAYFKKLCLDLLDVIHQIDVTNEGLVGDDFIMILIEAGAKNMPCFWFSWIKTRFDLPDFQEIALETSDEKLIEARNEASVDPRVRRLKTESIEYTSDDDEMSDD